MAWKIEFDKKAVKELAALDKAIGKRIVSFLKERIISLQDPRSAGESLKGQLKKFWKYRVGDYRVVCKIEDNTLVVLVLRIAHRRFVYKKSLVT